MVVVVVVEWLLLEPAVLVGEETAVGVRDEGAVSPEAGSLIREGTAVWLVVVVLGGGCWGWADRLAGWAARRMRREERRVEVKGEREVVGGLVLAIAVRK